MRSWRWFCFWLEDKRMIPISQGCVTFGTTEAQMHRALAKANYTAFLRARSKLHSRSALWAQRKAHFELHLCRSPVARRYRVFFEPEAKTHRTRNCRSRFVLTSICSTENFLKHYFLLWCRRKRCIFEALQKYIGAIWGVFLATSKIHIRCEFASGSNKNTRFSFRKPTARAHHQLTTLSIAIFDLTKIVFLRLSDRWT